MHLSIGILLVEVGRMLTSFAFMQSSGVALSLATASRIVLRTVSLFRFYLPTPDHHFAGPLHQRH